MELDSKGAGDAAQGVRALAQPIAAALSRAAIFGVDGETGCGESGRVAFLLR